MFNFTYVERAQPLRHNQIRALEEARQAINTIAFAKEVTVYETIHGHIIELQFTGVGSMRFVSSELIALGCTACRWFEFYERSVQLGIPYESDCKEYFEIKDARQEARKNENS